MLFLEGLPTKARTPEAEIYLGRVLFELGILSGEQLDALLPGLLEANRLHGQVLLAEGLITEEQLELGLRAQLVRQMKWLVHLSQETTYAYYDSFDGLASYGGDGHVGIDPYPIVWAGIRDEPPWEHVHQGLTGLGTARIRLSATAETERFAFDKAERATLELLRHDALRVYDLTESEVMSPRIVQLLVYCLLVTKQVEVVVEARASHAPIDDAPLSAPASSQPAPISQAEGAPGLTTQTVARVQLTQRPLVRPNVAVEEDLSADRMTAQAEGRSTSYVATQPRTRKRATVGPRRRSAEGASDPAFAEDDASRPASSQDPPVQPGAAEPLGPAGPAESSRPYLIPTPAVGMAAINDLVMSTLSLPPATGWASGPPEVPTVRRMAAASPAAIAAAEARVAQARATPRSVEAKPPSSGARATTGQKPPPPLPPRASGAPVTTAPAARPAVESTRAPISVKPASVKPADGANQTAPLASDAASPQATAMTAELVARKKEIQEQAAALDKMDYFQLLGVARDTPTAEIQKAFFGLAKKWHPDRVPATLADVKDLCAKVFGRMSEAHQTLMDAARRAKYEASIQSGSDDSPEAQAEVTAILGAAIDFQKAEICLKRNDVKQAEEFCTKAITVEPKQADYIAMMAWLQSLKPQKQGSGLHADASERAHARDWNQPGVRAGVLLPGDAAEATRARVAGDERLQAGRGAEPAERRRSARGAPLQHARRRQGKPSHAPSAKKDEGGGIFGKLFKK